MELSIEVSQEPPDTVVLTLTGSVDLVSKQELLRIGQRELANNSSSRLVVDLAGVAFMDSTGLGALVMLSNDADAAGVKFVLRRPSPLTDRLLSVSGMSEVFDREP